MDKPLYPSRSLSLFYGYEDNGVTLDEGEEGSSEPSQIDLWNKHHKERPITNSEVV